MENPASSYVCAICGNPATSSITNPDGSTIHLCSACNMEKPVEQPQGWSLATPSAPLDERLDAYVPNNYLRGFLGALVGAFIGSIAWIIIGAFGYIAALAGLAISLCAIKGYQIMRGKATRLSIVLILMACLLALVFAEFVTVDVVLYKEFVSQGYTVDIGMLIGQTVQLPFYDSEMTSAFFGDLGLGLVFMALGSWRLFRSLFQISKAGNAAVQS